VRGLEILGPQNFGAPVLSHIRTARTGLSTGMCAISSLEDSANSSQHGASVAHPQHILDAPYVRIHDLPARHVLPP
jgi:hypothetical protein